LRQASGEDLLGCSQPSPIRVIGAGSGIPLASILAMCTAAALCGCSSLEDVTAWVSSAGRETLAALGCRRNALGIITPPHPDTIVRVFTEMGAQQLADHAGAFLARHALPGTVTFPSPPPHGCRGIAVDGKAVRGPACEPPCPAGHPPSG
jgi:hypothetical protein